MHFSTIGTTTEPGQDQNAPTPPIPPDHQPVTPGFVQKLIDALEGVREERGKLDAEMYPPTQVSRDPSKYQPGYKRMEALRKRSEELSAREDSLRAALASAKHLIYDDEEQRGGNR